MKPNPLRIAYWSLAAGFPVILMLLTLTSPSPSLAWKIAEEHRYRARFPAFAVGETGTSFAIRKQKPEEVNRPSTGEAVPQTPLRTAERTGGPQRSRPE